MPCAAERQDIADGYPVIVELLMREDLAPDEVLVLEDQTTDEEAS